MKNKNRDELLEQLYFVFDGGVGIQGGVCGAIAGAIMAFNLLVGLDIRATTISPKVIL